MKLNEIEVRGVPVKKVAPPKSKDSAKSKPVLSFPVGKKVDGDERVTTGVRRTTILAPGKTWERITSKFDWRFQHSNFLKIQEALARNGYSLKQVSIITKTGAADYITRYSKPNAKANLTSFVAITPGVFVWEKYEGNVAGGGRNSVYVGGEAMKLTDFLRLPPNKQDVLIQRSKMVGKE